MKEITKADSLIGKACLAYNVQILLPELICQSLSTLQKDLQSRTTEPLWLCPPDTLHISIMPLIGAREPGLIDKEKRWEQERYYWTSLLTKEASNIRHFKISLNRICVTDSAVILLGDDDGTISNLRFAIDSQKASSMNIIHITLFRFTRIHRKPTELTCELQRNIIVEVENIHLVKEYIYPSLSTSVISTFQIAS